MDLVKSLVTVASAASIVALLITFASKSQPQVSGWRHLKPGPLYWTGVILGSAPTLGMSYIRLFVGSSRADAETQMTILTGLILAFAGMTIITAIQLVRLKRQAIRWRGNAIVFASGAGEVQKMMEHIVNTDHRPFGAVVLTFADGTRLPIDPYATTADELLERIAELRKA